MKVRHSLRPLEGLNRDIEEAINLISRRKVDHWVDQPKNKIQQAVFWLFEQIGLISGVESVILSVMINHEVTDSSASRKAFLFEKV